MIDERTIEQAAPSELPILAAEAARLHALCLARIVTPQVVPTCEPEADRLLTAEEASVRCGLTVEALKRRRDLPFRRKVGPKTVRFSARAIERWLKRAS